MWFRLLMVLIAGYLVWDVWRFLRHNPDALSEEKVRRSLPVFGSVVGLLVVVLFVAYLVLKYYG